MNREKIEYWATSLFFYAVRLGKAKRERKVASESRKENIAGVSWVWTINLRGKGTALNAGWPIPKVVVPFRECGGEGARVEWT